MDPLSQTLTDLQNLSLLSDWQRAVNEEEREILECNRLRKISKSIKQARKAATRYYLEEILNLLEEGQSRLPYTARPIEIHPYDILHYRRKACAWAFSMLMFTTEGVNVPDLIKAIRAYLKGE